MPDLAALVWNKQRSHQLSPARIDFIRDRLVRCCGFCWIWAYDRGYLLKTFEHNIEPTTVTGFRAVDIPFRVLVAEPDPTSRRPICALFRDSAGMTVICVGDSQLLHAIEETAPDLVIVDVHSPSIRRAVSWQMLGIQSFME